jgi:hypothetical protein
MVYKVSVTRTAEDDAYAAFEYVRKSAPVNAEKWLIGLFAAILSLDTLPARCPIIPEAEELGHDVRHLLYGSRAGIVIRSAKMIEGLHAQVSVAARWDSWALSVLVSCVAGC